MRCEKFGCKRNWSWLGFGLAKFGGLAFCPLVAKSMKKWSRGFWAILVGNYHKCIQIYRSRSLCCLPTKRHMCLTALSVSIRSCSTRYRSRRILKSHTWFALSWQACTGKAAHVAVQFSWMRCMRQTQVFREWRPVQFSTICYHPPWMTPDSQCEMGGCDALAA